MKKISDLRDWHYVLWTGVLVREVVLGCSWMESWMVEDLWFLKSWLLNKSWSLMGYKGELLVGVFLLRIFSPGSSIVTVSLPDTKSDCK